MWLLGYRGEKKWEKLFLLGIEIWGKKTLVYVHLQSLLVYFNKIMTLTKSPLHFNEQKGLI